MIKMVKHHIKFECNKLVKTMCDVEEDINPSTVHNYIPQELTSICLLADKSMGTRINVWIIN